MHFKINSSQVIRYVLKTITKEIYGQSDNNKKQ